MGVRNRVVVYVERDDGLLVFDHRDHPEAGTQVPAGGVEVGESIGAAAIREVREETGVRLDDLPVLLGTHEHLDGLGNPALSYFLRAAAPAGLPQAWEHMVSGDGEDATLVFDCRFDPAPDLWPVQSVYRSSGDIARALPADVFAGHVCVTVQNRFIMERHPGFDRVLAVWNGRDDVSALDELVTADYRGHIGSRARDLAGLVADIASYRAAVPGVVFRVEQQFVCGQDVATRLTAAVPTPNESGERTLAGLNMSRWHEGRLAEEWAVWESLEQQP